MTRLLRKGGFSLNPWVLACVAAVGLPALAGWTAAPPAPLPPGPGSALVYQNCQFCHTTEMIAEQRLSSAAWGKVVDKMIRWGAPVATADREVVVGYLARHFGTDAPRRVSPTTSP